MPSLFIFQRNVERFIPRRAAAPFGPPSTQPVSRTTLRICSRSASARVLGLVQPRVPAWPYTPEAPASGSPSLAGASGWYDKPEAPASGSPSLAGASGLCDERGARAKWYPSSASLEPCRVLEG